MSSSLSPPSASAIATAQAVPAGLKWSRDAAENAGKKAKYIHVGRDKAKGPTERLLSGAKSLWEKKEPETIYVPTYRITGSYDDVVAALQLAGEPDEYIRDALSKAITRDNAAQHADDFKNEDEVAKSLKKDKVETATAFSLDTVLWMQGHLGDETTVWEAKAKDQSSGLEAARAARTSGPTKSLYERYTNLGKDEVLNVSAMKANGTGATRTKRPKSSSKGFTGPAAVNIISNDPDNFQRAMYLVFGDDKMKEDAYQRVLAEGINMINNERARLGLAPGQAPPVAKKATKGTKPAKGSKTPGVPPSLPPPPAVGTGALRPISMPPAAPVLNQ